MKALIIADLHLKPKMFDQAHKLLEKGVADVAVCLGDLVDDWGEEFNLPLYARTMQRAIKFHKAHPDTLWCLGNHDAGYYWPSLGKRESGHSKFVEGEMRTWLDEFKRAGIEQKLYIKIDNCIFSHAGVNARWMGRHLTETMPMAGEPLTEVEEAGLWEEYSPLWWRPQPEWGGDPDEAWEKDKYLQVVGHSPMECPTQQGSILSCDVFSTYRDGAPYGNERYTIVDTKTKEWHTIGREDF